MYSSLNPIATASERDVSTLIRSLACEGLSQEELSELDDQLEATIPALIELRDAGHVTLNMRVVAESATLEGWMRLADDSRLSPLSRNRAAAIRDRYLSQGVKRLLGF